MIMYVPGFIHYYVFVWLLEGILCIGLSAFKCICEQVLCNSMYFFVFMNRFYAFFVLLCWPFIVTYVFLCIFMLDL